MQYSQCYNYFWKKSQKDEWTTMYFTIIKSHKISTLNVQVNYVILLNNYVHKIFHWDFEIGLMVAVKILLLFNTGFEISVESLKSLKGTDTRKTDDQLIKTRYTQIGMRHYFTHVLFVCGLVFSVNVQ